MLSFIFTESYGDIQPPRKCQSLYVQLFIKPEDACCINNKFSLAWTVNIDGNKTTLRLTLIVLKDQERNTYHGKEHALPCPENIQLSDKSRM